SRSRRAPRSAVRRSSTRGSKARPSRWSASRSAARPSSSPAASSACRRRKLKGGRAGGRPSGGGVRRDSGSCGSSLPPFSRSYRFRVVFARPSNEGGSVEGDALDLRQLDGERAPEAAAVTREVEAVPRGEEDEVG